MIKLPMNLKVRMRNKAFWIALVSGLMLLAQQLGLNVFPENTLEITNTILSILTLLGVFLDPTTDGVKDSELVMNKK